MKRVHYLAGSIGAAVPIFGMMMPSAAASAAPAQPARPGAKTVLLSHAAAARKGTDVATMSSSSVPVSPGAATAAGGCTGHTEVHATNASLSTKFYYTNGPGSDVCIGTVRGTFFAGDDNRQQVFRVRIYSGAGKKKRQAYNKSVGGNIINLTDISATQAIHRRFGLSAGHPIQVCTAWVDIGGLLSPTYSLVAGPQCRSVN